MKVVAATTFFKANCLVVAVHEKFELSYVDYIQLNRSHYTGTIIRVICLFGKGPPNAATTPKYRLLIIEYQY